MTTVSYGHRCPKAKSFPGKTGKNPSLWCLLLLLAVLLALAGCEGSSDDDGGGGGAQVTGGISLNPAGNVATLYAYGALQYTLDVSRHPTARIEPSLTGVIGTVMYGSHYGPPYTWSGNTLAFGITGLDPNGGDSVPIRLTPAFPAGDIAFTYKLVGPDAAPLLGSNYNGAILELVLTDNGPGDLDPTPGRIADPLGPVYLYSSENLWVQRHQLRLAKSAGAQSGAVPLYINTRNFQNLHWSINAPNFLTLSRDCGDGPDTVLVQAAAEVTDPGLYEGKLEITPLYGGAISVDVALQVSGSPDATPPVGEVNAPESGAVVAGTVLFTGWALDDTGVDSVKLYRQSGQNRVYLMDAALCEGTRPEMEILFPGYACNQFAGWNANLATRLLPNSGNGTFTLDIVAADVAGNETLLGSVQINALNMASIKPFGAIQTPASGGPVTGAVLISGWALTPSPLGIDPSGAGIQIFIDGVSYGNFQYGLYNQMASSTYPGYVNSDGAGFELNLDSNWLYNGVHSILLQVRDKAGSSARIGPQYFTVNN